MNVHNFELNKVFQQNAKVYQTRPVKAMKYQTGLENGFCVHYSNLGTKQEERLMHEGIRFFPSEDDAWEFINRSEKQYAKVNGVLTEIEVIYDAPMPVLYRKDVNAEELEGMHFCFGERAFISDESEDYEFFILEDDCWIIEEADGNIRVWYPDSDETFFGKKKDIVYEVIGNEYMNIAV